jgi:hypothetical protein
MMALRTDRAQESLQRKWKDRNGLPNYLTTPCFSGSTNFLGVLGARSRTRSETAVSTGDRCHGTSQNLQASASSRTVCHICML